VAFVNHLIKDCRIAIMPMTSFYDNEELGKNLVRINLCSSFENY